MKIQLIMIPLLAMGVFACGTVFTAIQGERGQATQEQMYEAALNTFVSEGFDIQLSDKPSLIQTGWLRFYSFMGSSENLKFQFAATDSGYTLTPQFQSCNDNSCGGVKNKCVNSCSKVEELVTRITSGIDERIAAVIEES